jgi:hypothetical protein
MPWIEPEIAPSVVACILNQEDNHQKGSLWLEGKPAENDLNNSE